MLVITASGIAFAPVVTAICSRSDKKKVLLGGVGLTGLLLIASRFVDVNSFGACCLVCLCYSIGNTCYWQLMPSMIYDVCEAEELASGEKHSGQVISLQALSESLATAVGSQILGVILQIARFDETASQQADSALTWISNSFTLIPGVCMVVVAVIIARHPVNKISFARIMKALERRRAGETIDLAEFEDIYGRKFIEKASRKA